jgi:hypothetical protein
MTFVDSTGKDLSRGATGKRAWVSGGRKARLLQEFAVSGLCAARFAKLAGVKPVTFYAWLRKQKAARTVTVRATPSILAEGLGREWAVSEILCVDRVYLVSLFGISELIQKISNQIGWQIG